MSPGLVAGGESPYLSGMQLPRHTGRLTLAALLLFTLLASARFIRAAEPGAADCDPAPRIGLVLSGGGSRGHAHVGVLKALEEAQLPVYCIVGSSVGAVVGGLYASGYSPGELDTLLRAFSWQEIVNSRPDRRYMYTGRKEISDHHQLQVRFDGLKPDLAAGLSTGQRVSQLLSEMVWRAPVQCFGDFDQLDCRFRAISTDLITGEQVELANGDLAEAMRASTSLPILFEPVEWQGRLLVDGGISANIPVETARSLGADYVIAVDVTSPLRGPDDLDQPWEVADQVAGIMQTRLNAESRLKADLLVVPDLPEILLSQDGNPDELREAGYQAMREKLADLDLRPEKPESAVGRSLNPDWPKEFDSVRLLGLEQVARGLRNPQLAELEIFEKEREFWLSASEAGLGEAAIHRLVTRLKEAGYTFALLDEVTVDGRQATARINPGLVDAIRVTGLTNLHPSLVTREFRPRAGEPFRVDVVEASISRIYALGVFRTVTVHMKQEDGQSIAEVQVAELSYPLLRAGLHYSTPRQGEFFGQLIWESLFGRSLRGELSWLYGTWRQEQKAVLESDRIWRTWLTSRFCVGLEEEELWLNAREWSTDEQGVHLLERQRLRLEARVGQQISRLGTVYASMGAEQSAIDGYATIPSWNTIRFSLESIVDSRDRLGLTRQGEYHIVSAEELVEEGIDRSHRFQARFDSWRTWGRWTGHSTFYGGWSDSPRRWDRLEFGGEDWLRSLNQLELVASQAAGVRLEARRHLGGDWFAAAAWTLMVMNEDTEKRLQREDLLQELGLCIQYESLAGPLYAGVSRLTEQNRGLSSGWKARFALGVPF
jgi:predicted acylesterase/phospholipase RssA